MSSKNNIKSGLLAKKIGMISYYEGKNLLPVTVLQVLDCNVVKKKTNECDGYNAVVINYGSDAKKMTKAMKHYFPKEVEKPKKYLKELRFVDDIYNNLKINDTLSIDQFSSGAIIDIVGKSIGKGYAGVMKRHNFRGLEASHGVSIAHRSQGSTGGCQEPGKVFKGKKMAGHLGNKKITIQNLSIVKIDQEKKAILVKGSLPGAKNSIVLIKNAVKKS